jgi:hypothetical protein
MNCYLLTWTLKKGDQLFPAKEIVDYLDTLQDIKNWRNDVGAIFLVSELSPTQLHSKIHRKFPELRYIITPIDINDIEGWAPKDTWDFIRYPKPV